MVKDTETYMKGWYNTVTGHTPPPAWVSIKQITVEWVALYHHMPPLGDNIPVVVDPFLVNDSVP